MNTARRACLQVLLILPALLFLGAVVLRNIQLLHTGAQQIVMWYAVRMWTLWILLLALPVMVFATGCATLFNHRSHGTPTPDGAGVFAAMRADRMLRIVALLTLTAGVILAIVVLHMGAN
jgi:hypothetical protein